MSEVDAIEVEVVSQSLVGVVQQMQNSLFRTGYSTIIRESRDASCAILDTGGRVIAQHTVLPLHLGAFPASVAAVVESYPIDQMRDGDVYIVNHPYFGGSPHASDMGVIAPVVVGDDVFAFSGSIAHKSDIGGLVPGTNSGQAREIFHEGLLLPPVRLYRGFELVREVETILRANSRTPRLVMGDLHGQVGAARLATDRIRWLCGKYGADTIRHASEGLLEQTERRLRAAVASWPDGTVPRQSDIAHRGNRGRQARGDPGGGDDRGRPHLLRLQRLRRPGGRPVQHSAAAGSRGLLLRAEMPCRSRHSVQRRIRCSDRRDVQVGLVAQPGAACAGEHLHDRCRRHRRCLVRRAR